MKILSCPPPNDTLQIMQGPLRLIRRPDQPNSCRGPAEHRNIMKVLPSLQPNEKSHLTKLCRFFLLFQPIKITTDKIVQVPLRLIRSPDQPTSCQGRGAPRRFLLHHNILFLYILHFLRIVIISTFVGCYIRILRGYFTFALPSDMQDVQNPLSLFSFSILKRFRQEQFTFTFWDGILRCAQCASLIAG